MKIKKYAFVGVLATAAFALAACQGNNPTTTEAPKTTTETKTTTEAPNTTTTTTEVTTTTVENTPLSYAEFIATENGEEVTIQAVIQDRCTWYNNAASFYLADEDGGYYAYNMPCTAEEYATLVPGTEVKVTGAKAEWKGEVEISFATPTENSGWEIASTGKTLNSAKEAANIAKDTLDNYKNQKVKVEATVTKAGYTNHDDFTLDPAAGTDVYFQVKDALGNEATYVVEAYLEDTQFGSDTYTKACNLSEGDFVTLEGFVYYWENPQLQVTSISKALTYTEYLAVENDEEVTIQAVIQDRCTWYNNAASFYLADEDGGYYAYNMPCTAEEYATLVPGTEVLVTGAKAEWKGEVEISFATPTENSGWKIVATEKPVHLANNVEDIKKETLDEYKNQLVCVEVEVVKAAYTNHDTFELVPAAGTDVYFQVKDALGNEATYVVEAYLEDTQFGSDTYTAVCDLAVGDKIILVGFVYYWENPQLQVTSVSKKA